MTQSCPSTSRKPITRDRVTCDREPGHLGPHTNGTHRWANRTRRPRRTPPPASYTPADRAADQAARYGGTPEPPLGGGVTVDAAGIPHGPGTFTLSDCPRCDLPMPDRRAMVKTTGGKWIHKTCANGADDE